MLDGIIGYLQEFWAWLVTQLWPMIQTVAQQIIAAGAIVVSWVFHFIWNPADLFLGLIFNWLPTDNLLVEAFGYANWIFPMDSLVNVLSRIFTVWVALWIMKVAWRILPLFH